jgi:hypothetical protein
MGDGNQEPQTSEPMEELFESSLGEFSDELMDEFEPISSEKQRLVAKRRLAEQRLEERRLREELGDYDLEFDDF